MALQDILQAISEHADQEIRSFREKHKKAITRLREESERCIAAFKQEIASERNRRKEEISTKTQSRASMQERNAILQKKQLLLDQIFKEILDALAVLPESSFEAIFKECLVRSRDGEIRSSKRHMTLLKKIAPPSRFCMGEPISAVGGFLVVSEKQERDFTLEYFVEHMLRPKTELDIARTLFLQ